MTTGCRHPFTAHCSARPVSARSARFGRSGTTWSSWPCAEKTLHGKEQDPWIRRRWRRSSTPRTPTSSGWPRTCGTRSARPACRPRAPVRATACWTYAAEPGRRRLRRVATWYTAVCRVQGHSLFIEESQFEFLIGGECEEFVVVAYEEYDEAFG